MQPPRGRRGGRNRAGHNACSRPRSRASPGRAAAGACPTHHRHAEPFDRLRTGLFRHPPGGCGQAAGWIPACAGMRGKREEAIHPPPSSREPAPLPPDQPQSPQQQPRSQRTQAGDNRRKDGPAPATRQRQATGIHPEIACDQRRWHE